MFFVSHVCFFSSEKPSYFNLSHFSVPEDEIKNYISVYGLRTHGEINGTPVSLATNYKSV